MYEHHKQPLAKQISICKTPGIEWNRRLDLAGVFAEHWR